MTSKIIMSYIYIVILVVLQATNAAGMNKLNPRGIPFQPGRAHKIIGGTKAKLGEIPHQVEILWNDDYWCGGTLVAPTFLVTAAHCFDLAEQNELKIRAGHISHSSPGSTAQTKLVKNIKVHEMWNGVENSFRNDIAVLELDSAMQINNLVKTIQIPCQECTVGVTVNQILSGWGQTENETNSPILMKVNLKVVSQTKCNELWEGILGIKSGQICAGTNGNNTCIGDSGGPLATNSGVNRLVGENSIVTCNNGGKPTIFTRVHQYSDWIHSNTT